MRLIVVMAHDTRLLMTALYADEYLLVQTKDAAGWLNQLLESQLTTAVVAARRRRRLNKGAHMISFRARRAGARAASLLEAGVSLSRRGSNQSPPMKQDMPTGHLSRAVHRPVEAARQ